MKKERNPFTREILRNFALISELGLSVVVSVLIFIFAFVYLDKKLNTDGKIVIVGVVLGVIVGIMAAYRLLQKHFKD